MTRRHSLLLLALLATSCVFTTQEIEPAGDGDITPDMRIDEVEDMRQLPDLEPPAPDQGVEPQPQDMAPEMDVEPEEDMGAACSTDQLPFNNGCIYPSSCQQLLDAGVQPLDGDYRLFIDGEETKPWEGHCMFNGSQGRTYLTVENPGAMMSNTAHISPTGVVGGMIPVMITVTHTKVRVEPTPGGLRVDVYDATHATVTPPTQGVVAYGAARACGGAQESSANINLRATDFRLDAVFDKSGDGDGQVNEQKSFPTPAIGARVADISIKKTSQAGERGCSLVGPEELIDALRGGEQPAELGYYLQLIYDPRR